MKFISKKCAELTPYICGEQPQDKKYIKLNTNENPYPPTGSIRAFLDGADISSLRLYPDPENRELREAIAEKYNTKKENIFVGNGSDEILSFVYSAFFNADGKGVATADISYSFYPVYAAYYGVRQVSVPLREDYSINLDDYRDLDVEGYMICNPNAPTGMVIKKDIIEDFIRKNPSRLVIVDEAYVDFCSESVIELTKIYDNLLVIRTFSKSFSLAGIRCGYAIGAAELIDALNRVKNSFNSYTVNRLTEKIAKLAIRDEKYFIENIEKVKLAREFITEKLRSVGFNVLPSGSNFIFAESPDMDGETLYKSLRDRGILVRYFKKPRIDNFLRITVGAMADMETLFNIVCDIVK